MLPRRKEFVTSVIGIMKAGAAYVPIDPEYPEERKRFMIKDCEAKVVITQEMLEGFRQRSSTAYFTTSVNLAVPEGLAYMIYTSGSTGRPKGSILRHSALANMVRWYTIETKMKESDRCAEHANFSFDISIDDLIAPLSVGASVHILPEEIIKDLYGIYNYLEIHRIDCMTMSTAVGMELLNNYDLSLRVMTVGGEKLNPVKPSSVKLINGYGPTEFTVYATTRVVDYEADIGGVPIGRPVANSWSFVCDEYGNLLPKGVTGELCLSGDQISTGYWHRPELTAEKFIDCPYLPGHKMYRTGDLVRWNEDGQLEFIGRIDNQVKLRGFRIELEEIESISVQVAEQAVAIINNNSIALYWSGTIEEEALKLHLKERLAEYMLPSVYIHLESIPLTANGKINRKSLPDVNTFSTYVAPSSNREAALCYYLSTVLNVNRIGVTESLKSLGMNSLSALRATLQLNKKSIRVSLEDVMKSDTVRDLAKKLESQIGKCGYWFDGYDTNKETVVFVLGLVAEYHVKYGLGVLGKIYNIYILETYYLAWKDFNSITYSEALERYYCQMKEDIPSFNTIRSFVGFSLGGEFAYNLACVCMMHQKIIPMVMLGDTMFPVKELQQHKMDENWHPDLQLTIKYLHEATDNLGYYPIRRYMGQVILLSAVKDNDLFEINEKQWKKHVPSIRIIRMNDSHDDIYAKSDYYSYYASLLSF